MRKETQPLAEPGLKSEQASAELNLQQRCRKSTKTRFQQVCANTLLRQWVLGEARHRWGAAEL